MRATIYSGYTIIIGLACSLPAMFRWYVKTHIAPVGFFDQSMIAIFYAATDFVQMIAMGMFFWVFYLLWYVSYPDA
jgi:hypothetical protein